MAGFAALSSIDLTVPLYQQWTISQEGEPQIKKKITVPTSSEAFTTYFDNTQTHLETLASMDDLHSGI